MLIIAVTGGLGNQMFQYAFSKALQQCNKEVKLDVFSYYAINGIEHNGYELNRIFKINVDLANLAEIKNYFGMCNLIGKVLRRLHVIKRKTFYKCENRYGLITFEPSVFHMEEKYLWSCWQSEKYFKNIEKTIRENFEFTLPLDEESSSFAEQMKHTNSVSVHVRRGDYLKYTPLKNICTLTYYKNAIREIYKKVNNPVFYIFSNDILWCKENLKFQNAIFITGNLGKDSYKDMQLMSYCKHNIIANSTFSWWGAWLNSNPDKIVIAPDKWFNGIDGTGDVIPEQWFKVRTI